MFDAIMKVVAACIAIYGLRTWRLQLVGKRRFEIAEEAVVAANKVKDDLEWIRTDAFWTSEAEGRPRAEGEPPNVQRALDRYYIPLKRSQEANDDFAALAKCRLLCSVHFGDRTKEPFQKLFGARAKVLAAANTMSGLARSEQLFQMSIPEIRVIEARIWGLNDDADADAGQIKAAVTEIEQICRPHMSVVDEFTLLKSFWSRLVARAKRC